MIIDFILLLPYQALNALISLLPASSGFPDEVNAAAVVIGSQMGVFTPVFPVADLAAALALVSSGAIAIWTWKTFKWISSHIPLIGGRGV